MNDRGFRFDLETALQKARQALAVEIAKNPDRSWRDSLDRRYREFLRDNGADEKFEDPETWQPGMVESTEAILRSLGYEHV